MPGEASRNPNSTQFRGPLPDFKIDVGLAHAMVPPQDWIDANREALASPNPPQPPPEICTLNVVLVGQMTYPSNLIPQQHWPAAATAIAPIASIPFADFKKRIDELLAGASVPKPAANA